PAYVAPELLQPTPKPSRTSDQYSLAISYAELRTGTLPFTAKNRMDAMAVHVTGNLDLSKLTLPEQAIIRRATALEPDKRYPSATEMVQALRQVLDVKPKIRPRVDALLQAGSAIVPGYKLESLLGKGGYGEVWKAMAPGGKPCALKIVRNLDAAKGKQEFRSLKVIQDLEHDNLIELHAYWLLDGDG